MIDRDRSEAIEKDKFDIDTKHDLEPVFASIVAEELYGFLRSLEKTKLTGNGDPLTSATPNGNLETDRMRVVNWLFEMSTSLKVGNSHFNENLNGIEDPVQHYPFDDVLCGSVF